MAYLLLDERLAIHTNLLEDDSPCYRKTTLNTPSEIKDIYEFILNDLLSDLVKGCDGQFFSGLSDGQRNVLTSGYTSDSPFHSNQDEAFLNRKFIKNLFMPLIYGKTKYSIGY